jgi:hypothetical protein
LNKENTERPRRSVVLKILVIGYLVVSLLGWLRVQQVISSWDWLSSLGINVSLWYILISGACWGIMGLFIGFGLWFCQAWAPALARVGVIIFTIWYWCDTLLLVQNDFSRTNMPFMVVLNAFCLLYVFICLTLPVQKRFFNKNKKI